MTVELPCLDYFGTTVNRAARVQSCAAPAELTLSREVFEDPEVREGG